MLRYNPDSRLSRALSFVTTNLTLAILFISLSLPIITLGVTMIAGFSLYLPTEHPAYPIRAMLHQIKANFKTGLILSVLCELGIGIFGFASWFWMHQSLWFAFGLAIICLFFSVYILAVFVYATALTAQYAVPLKQNLKNAVMFPVLAPLSTLGLFLTLVLLIGFSLVFPLARPVLAIFGPLLCCYIWATIINSAIKNLSSRQGHTH